MSIVEMFDCQQCLHKTDRDRFIFDSTLFRVRDTKTGWILGVYSYRFSEALEIRDDAGSLLARLYCSVETRSLDSAEQSKFSDQDIAGAIKWSINWPAVYDQKPVTPGLTRQYIVDFFCFYKLSIGVGKYVDGVAKDAIVYVDIDSS